MTDRRKDPGSLWKGEGDYADREKRRASFFCCRERGVDTCSFGKEVVILFWGRHWEGGYRRRNSSGKKKEKEKGRSPLPEKGRDRERREEGKVDRLPLQRRRTISP